MGECTIWIEAAPDDKDGARLKQIAQDWKDSGWVEAKPDDGPRKIGGLTRKQTDTQFDHDHEKREGWAHERSDEPGR